jgi:hypothetical protein
LAVRYIHRAGRVQVARSLVSSEFTTYEQMLRGCVAQVGVPTKCNCLPNGNYDGGRRFDCAMDCDKDEDFACGCALPTSH